MGENDECETVTDNWETGLEHKFVKADGALSDDIDVQCHKGFHDAYLSVIDDLVEWFGRVLDKSIGTLRIAGHSLGAAVGTLIAVHFQRLGWHVECVVTFGSPRVGNRGFKMLYESMGLSEIT